MPWGKYACCIAYICISTSTVVYILFQHYFTFHSKTTNCKLSLESSISLQQNQILLGTQAFASPPDMASSGVWEIVILPKTPTFEGVSGWAVHSAQLWPIYLWRNLKKPWQQHHTPQACEKGMWMTLLSSRKSTAMRFFNT